MRRRLRTDHAAFALVECTIATAVSALFLGSLFLMNSSAMDTIQLARESACASQVLQQRVQSMRIANWHHDRRVEPVLRRAPWLDRHNQQLQDRQLV